MLARRSDDPAAWLEEVTPLLLRDEARHNLMLGLAHRLVHQPEDYPEHRLWTVHARDAVVGAMLQTPPFPVVVARPAAEGVLEALVEAAQPDVATITGANGVRPEIDAFGAAWAARTGRAVHEVLPQGIYEARAVRDVPSTEGTARPAGIEDLDEVAAMTSAFLAEALPDSPIRDTDLERTTVLRRLEADPSVAATWVWEVEGRIVALTGHSGRTPHGIRIGPVYTWPAARGRGYATALVHAQTAFLLATMVDVCFLYTDLSNATSNGVYRRIGYELVAEAVELGFEPQVQSGGSGA
jgi:predicted GNAT family acetyltransferase